MMMLLLALVPAVVFGQACSDPPKENACSITGGGDCGSSYFQQDMYSDTKCETITSTSCTKIHGDVTCKSLEDALEQTNSGMEMGKCFDASVMSFKTSCDDSSAAGMVMLFAMVMGIMTSFA